MSKIIPFTFDSLPVRVVDQDGEPWFVAADVAKVLGYSNPRKAIGDHCKGVTKRDTPTPGGIQQLSFIPERDVYRLIMRSKLPAAERFEEWVVSEVLPSIRRHGGYITGQDDAADPEVIMAKALQVAQSVIERKARELDQARHQIEEAKPKVEVYDRISAATGAMTLTAAAKAMGIGPRKLINAMLSDRILYRQGGNLLAYQQHIDVGRFVVKLGEANGHAYAHLKVTGEGVQWLAGRYVTELAE